jgi:hypothetical protein
MHNNTLLFVTQRDPLDQTIRSMVSQLLELGICSEFGSRQSLPREIPAEIGQYPAILIDDPMLPILDMQPLDAYARGCGHVWRLEEPIDSVVGAEHANLGLNDRMLIDHITQNRAHVLAMHSGLKADRPRLRQLQMRQTPQSQTPRLIEQVKSWLNRLQCFEESTYQYWTVARVLIEDGHEELLPLLRESVEQAIAIDHLPFHADGIGGLHHVFWLAERDGRSDWMDKARALGEEFCKRRPRNGCVLAGTGYVNDSLGTTSGEPVAFRLMVNGYRDVFWTESMRTNPPLMAAMSRLTGDQKYFDECERYVQRLEASHLRPDGLLAHFSREEALASASAPVWARGVAHGCYGLLSTLEALPEGAPLRTRIQQLLLRIVRGLLPHQDTDSGLWRNVIDMPESRLDTSGSVSLACVLYTGLEQGWLDEDEFAPVTERLFEGLWQMYWHGGLCAHCRGTAASKDVVYYLARPQGWSQAPYLVMAIVLRRQWLRK